MKYSFHIVIDKLMHENKDEACAFYRLVYNELPQDIQNLGFLDPQVYSSFQNLRLLYCQKQNSGRIKLLDPVTKYIPDYPNDHPEGSDKDTKVKQLSLFAASLLSF